MKFFKNWRIERLKRKLNRLREIESHYDKEQRRLAFAAYDLPDMMAEPMRWGRLQNASNWAGYHKRDCQKAAEKIELQLQNLEKDND